MELTIVPTPRDMRELKLQPSEVLPQQMTTVPLGERGSAVGIDQQATFVAIYRRLSPSFLGLAIRLGDP